MTDQLTEGNVPHFDVADRLRKALRHADVGVQEMADELGMSRNSVSAYVNGRGKVDRRTLMVWALKTGVSFEWLETGRSRMSGGPDGDGGLPRLDSKPGTCRVPIRTGQRDGPRRARNPRGMTTVVKNLCTRRGRLRREDTSQPCRPRGGHRAPYGCTGTT